LQDQLEHVIRDGWVCLPNHGYVHAQLYFTGLRQIVGLLLAGRGSERLRAGVRERYGLSVVADLGPAGTSALEQLPVPARRDVLLLALSWLSDWPEGFLQICRENRVWRSTLCRGLNPAPFWYWKVIHDFLDRTRSATAGIQLRPDVFLSDVSSRDSDLPREVSTCANPTQSYEEPRHTREDRFDRLEEMSGIPVEELRRVVDKRIASASLRQVARDLQLSPTTIRNFLCGRAPYARTRKRLTEWYTSQATSSAIAVACH
jgi:hypothetical protein